MSLDLAGLDPDRLAAWLAEVGVPGTLTDGRPLSGGTQNLMLTLTVGDRRVVLRHPPVHRREHSDRSLGREMRVLEALAETDVPHAPLLGGARDSVLLDGATAFVTDFVDGFNPGDAPGPDAYADQAWRSAATCDVAASFARLGDLDTVALGLGDLGRPDGFLERQIDLTLRTWDAVGAVSGSSVDVPALGEWLRTTLPPASRPGITHGDAHLNNVLLANDAPRTAAIVDLEMVTVGDPLLDLGWLLACWPDDAEPFAGAALARRGPLASRAEVVEAYTAATDRDVDHLDWYVALASVKLAVLLETTYARSLRGEAPVETGRWLHDVAGRLLVRAEAVRRGADPA